MPEPRPTTAALLAGGLGSRIGRDLPKQLLEVAGRPILEHTLATFERHPDVDDILVLMAPGHLDQVRSIIRERGYRKVSALLEGAPTRSGTTMLALDAIAAADGKVLLHDAVRPFVSPRIISDCVKALDTYAAVSVAIPSADTIFEVTPEDTVLSAPPRSALRRAQTPQAFRLPVIREAYARARRDPAFEATDDCTVVLRYLPEVAVRVVPGDERNIKVTQPVDLYLAEALLRLEGDGSG